MIERQEIMQTIELLHKTFDNLAVRGLRAIGPQQLSALESLRDELVGIGAYHLAERIQTVAAHIKSSDARAASALMNAQASLRVFERLITIDFSREQLQSITKSSQEAEGIRF